MKLPVEPERLRARFPSLTDEDVEAFETVTRRVLASPSARGLVLAELMAAGRRAEEQEASGAVLGDEEHLALRYLRAVHKMQG